MTDRIHVTMTVDLFVEDENAMRESAYERMREAWTSDDDFPFDSAADVPLGQVVHSLLADALPADLPGCRRSQLDVEAEASESQGEQDSETHVDEPTQDRGSDGASDDSASDDNAVESHDSSDDNDAKDGEDDKADRADDRDAADTNGDDAPNDTDEHSATDDSNDDHEDDHDDKKQ